MAVRGDYQRRVVDEELTRRLRSAGGVLIEGPKACGKTATARQHAASEALLDVDDSARLAAQVDPPLLLEGATPRLIDEWQLEPQVWNHVRRTIDDRRDAGQFILAGSSMPADDTTRHTGAGRISRLRMRTMSLWETGHSIGTVSVASLLETDAPVRTRDPGLDFDDLVERISIGGWPGLLVAAVDDAIRWNRDYLEEIRRLDIRRVDGVEREPERVGRVLRSLARNVATEAGATTIATDASGSDGGVSDDTVRDYVDALTRLMIIEDQPPWSPRLRSRSRLRKSPKRHFVDPALAVAALQARPDDLRRDLSTLGLLFESLVVRDLRVYAQAVDGTVYHYRDNTGLEVDAIIDAGDGRWAAFEIKLGGSDHIEAAAASLQRFAERVDTAVVGTPRALGVIVATGLGYTRDDGVAVIPVGALAP